MTWQLKYQDAVEESRAEGLLEGKIEFAKAMIADGVPIDKIMHYTGLTLEEVEKCR